MSDYSEIDKLAEHAEQLLAANQLAEAEKILVKVLGSHPQHARSLYALGRIAELAGAKNEALNLIGKAAYLAPKNPTPLLHLADLLVELSKIEEAKSCFELCMQRFPQVVDVHVGYAGVLVANGEKEAALEILKQASQRFPDNVSLLFALVETGGKAEYEELKENLLRLSQGHNLPANEQMKVHFALGKIYDFDKQYPQAFASWKKANEIQFQQCHFKTEQLADGFIQIKKQFAEINKQEFNNQNFDVAEYDCAPIFIVGLPRSGTTLVEQVVASHSEVESIGESDIVATQVIRMIESVTRKPYPNGLNLITVEQRKAIGLHLCKLMAERGGEKKFVIDKLPANFQSIGLIKFIAPHAKFIQVSRNLNAVGLSIYRNYFKQNEPYFCNLEELRIYSRYYQDLMSFWKENGVSDVFSINYEKFIDNFEKSARELIDFLELGWQDSCLSFHQNNRFVTTLSHSQVKQPIYKSSMEHWKNYQAEMELFE